MKPYLCPLSRKSNSSWATIRLLLLLGFYLGTGAVSLKANVPGAIVSGTSAAVTLTGTAGSSTTSTMSNGIVSILCSKSGGSITQINYTYNNNGTTRTTNLLSGGNNGGQLYWENSSNQGLTFTYAVVADPATNGGTYAEIALTTTTVANITLEVHYAMLKGSSGFYVAAIWRHGSGDGAFGMGECRNNIYAGSMFDWMSVDATRNKLMQVSGGTTVGVNTAPVECSLWTSGLYQGQYEDKYKYSAAFGVQRAWGWSSVDTTGTNTKRFNVGLWDVSASSEYYNGGPLKLELMCHMGTTILNMFNGGHYGMGSDNDWAAGEVWSKVYGPYFVYCNNVSSSIADPVQASQALYTDALAQATAEATAWPYSWFNNNPDYALSAKRGTVTGKIVINDAYNPNASAANLWVGVVQQPVTVNSIYDFQQWLKPYQYWVKSGTDGSFTIPAVISGSNYTLYAFGPGAPGTFISQSQTAGTSSVNPPFLTDIPASPFAVIVGTSGSTTNLGTVTWKPARVGPTVFEIGYPNRTGNKFRHGDDWWVGDIGPSPTSPSPVWTKFMEYAFDFPNGPNYIVGQSRWSTDWNFIQPIVYDSQGNIKSTSSTITFTLPSVPKSGTASLYIGLASDYYGALIVTVNGTNTLVSGNSGVTASPSALPSTGFVPSSSRSDSSIREGINGAFSDERVTFPVSTASNSLLHAGTNTITFSLRQIGGSYFANHAMYDYLRLEMTGYVPPAPASVAAYAGNGRAFVCWPVTPGAAGYNILRTTTSGSNYASLATGVTGPVCGSGLQSAAYVDASALNGTTYYYTVQSVNTTGTSVSSPRSNGVMPSSGGPTSVPAAPAALTATGTNGRVILNWSAPTDASYYTINRSTLVSTGAGSYNTLGTIALSNTATGTTYTDNSVTNGTLYSYTVTPANSVGSGSVSVSANAIPRVIAPVAGPPTFTAAASQGTNAGSMALSWSSISGATGYNIQRATLPVGPYTYLQTTAQTTYTDNSLGANTTYYYQLTANNSGGTSPAVTASDTTPSAAPANIIAVAGNTQVTLNWTAAAGASGYIIARGTATGGPYTTIASNVPGAGYTNGGLTNGALYYYVVASTGSNGTGANSSEVSVAPVATVPIAPTEIIATPGNAQVSLRWNPSVTATSYTVKRATADGGPYTNLAASVSGTTYINTPATNGTTFYYVVSGSNASGNGANSAQVSTTPVAIPTSPTGLTATGSNSQVLLTWTASSGATSYILKRGTASGQEITTVSSTIAGASYTDSAVTNGTTYYYVVSGSNASGVSGDSNEASAKSVQTFSQWIAASFPGQNDPLIIGNTADPDGDGAPNLLEYFLGTNPGASDAIRLTCVLNGRGNAVVTFRMAKNLIGVAYTVEQSTDLKTWTNTGLQGDSTDMGGYYSVKVTIPLNGNMKTFFRISVSSSGS
jgi:rhamnogalacturonan endolyase